MRAVRRAQLAARQKPLQGEGFASPKGYFFYMWFLKQLHNLVFRSESSIFFQICHILSVCVGVPTLPGKKKKKTNSSLGCLLESAACGGQLGWMLWRFPSCFALLLSFVAQHYRGKPRCAHYPIADACCSVRRMSHRALNLLPHCPVGGWTLSQCSSSRMLGEEDRSRCLSVLICAALPSRGRCRPCSCLLWPQPGCSCPRTLRMA